ncbi:MAG: hypothetical protein ACREJC_01600 [Tepidisphaeraceae bacterium]
MAKKSESKKSETTEKKPAAPKKAPEKKPAAPAGSPMIDTALAASAAAAMLSAGMNRKSSGAKQPESAMFKQLKTGLAKPHATTMSNLLDKSAPPSQKKSAMPFDQKQIGHNQTFNADVTRSGVPRRTPG